MILYPFLFPLSNSIHKKNEDEEEQEEVEENPNFFHLLPSKERENFLTIRYCCVFIPFAVARNAFDDGED